MISNRTGRKENCHQLVKWISRLDSKFVSSFILYYILTAEFEMNNADEVLQVISIGLVAAFFLLNTNRYLKGLELCKECLFILKDRAGLKDEKLSKSFYKRIYFTMWKACSIISDNTSAMKYAEKLLQIYHESGETLEEYKLSRDLLKTH